MHTIWFIKNRCTKSKNESRILIYENFTRSVLTDTIILLYIFWRGKCLFCKQIYFCITHEIFHYHHLIRDNLHVMILPSFSFNTTTVRLDSMFSIISFDITFEGEISSCSYQVTSNSLILVFKVFWKTMFMFQIKSFIETQ